MATMVQDFDPIMGGGDADVLARRGICLEEERKIVWAMDASSQAAIKRKKKHMCGLTMSKALCPRVRAFREALLLANAASFRDMAATAKKVVRGLGTEMGKNGRDVLAMMHGVEKDVATMVSGVKHVLGRLCDSTATRLVFRANSTMMQAMPTWCIERTQRAQRHECIVDGGRFAVCAAEAADVPVDGAEHGAVDLCEVVRPRGPPECRCEVQV